MRAVIRVSVCVMSAQHCRAGALARLRDDVVYSKEKPAHMQRLVGEVNDSSSP